MAKEPTFEDVKDEERKWDSDFIIDMYEKGHKIESIQDMLPPATTPKVALGVITRYKRMLGVRREQTSPKRWNNNSTDSKAKH